MFMGKSKKGMMAFMKATLEKTKVDSDYVVSAGTKNTNHF